MARASGGRVAGGHYNRDEEVAGYNPPGDDDKYTVREYSAAGGGAPFNDFINRSYSGAEESAKCSKLREKALEGIGDHRGRLQRRQQELHRKRDEFEEGGKFKEIGDLITSNLHRMSDGQRWLETENYYHGNEPIKIELDPSLSPAENAERYFQKYRKAKSGLYHVKKEIASLKEELQKLEQTEAQLTESSDLEFIEKTSREFRSPKKKPSGKAGEKIPGLRFRSGNFTILLGRNAKENDTLLRHHVQGNDYWLHSRDYPGGYVFIKAIKGKSVPLKTLLDAGNLALYYSKEKNSGTGELYYTQVKYLRRAKHGKLGMVIPTQEKNLTVTLDSSRLQGLLNQQSEDIV